MIEPLGAIAVGSSILGGAAGTAGKYIDLINAPDQLRATGNLQSAAIANGGSPFIEEWYVEDYETVADTYEKTGYRVDETHNEMYREDMTEFLASFLTRWYFDPLQVTSVELDSDINIPSEMLEDIRMRLANGIRIWPYAFSLLAGGEIGDFRYDNVEVDYI